MPETLSARIGFGKYNDFRVDDEAVLYTTYSGGASGLFILSTGEGTRQERLEISGSKGTAILTGNRLSIHRYNRDLTEYAETALVNAREELTETVTEEAFDFDETSQPRILENFVKAIEDNESLIVPGKEGIRALELSNAAYLSAWTKETVSLPIDAVRYQKLLEEHQKEEMKCGQQ
jgi:predicted dehydrogenase